MSLQSKIDFAVIFSVKNANPNGDPLNGNRPRTTLDGLGELSDVCIKRKIRDRLLEKGVSIFVQSEDRKSDEYNSLRARADASQCLIKDDKKKSIQLACEKWFDVRAFGQLFAFKDTKKNKKTKKNKNTTDDDKDEEEAGGSDSTSIGIRGPISIHSAFSISPVSITSTQITKSVNSEEESKKGSDTMGWKHRIDQGTYIFFGSINPQLADKTGFSDEDAKIFKEILPKLFENDASSARPEGSMRVLKVLWWHHGSREGKYSSARVHSSVILKDDPNNFLELKPLENLTPEIIEGF
jgi:CRISPR-associated protein Csd2